MEQWDSVHQLFDDLESILMDVHMAPVWKVKHLETIGSELLRLLHAINIGETYIPTKKDNNKSWFLVGGEWLAGMD